jgi:hypothetical protein
MNRDLGPRMQAAVAADTELQERGALKRVGMAAAMTAALAERRRPGLAAHLASEVGVLAFKQGFAEWCDADHQADHDLAHYTLSALNDLRAAATSLG